MAMQTPIRFDLIGTNERTRAALAMAFNGRARGSCEFAVNGNADAVIVDLDGVGARTEWSRYRHEHPTRPSVLLTISECTVPETAIILVKPIRIEALLAAVEDVRRRIETGDIHAPGSTLKGTPTGIQKTTTSRAVVSEPEPIASMASAVRSTVTAASRGSASESRKPVPATPANTSAAAKAAVAEPVRDFREVCGIAEDIDCDDADLVRLRTFDADATLLDWMRRAVARSDSTRAPVTLAIQDREMVTVAAHERMARITFTDEILKHICTKKYPASIVTLQSVQADKLNACDKAGGETVALEALLWKTALWTYQGRLPAGTPINERIYLRRWPNLTRLLEVPDAMRIAALMVEQPLTLPRVAEALAIPQRHVFAFYAAAHAAGLASLARREADHLVAQAAPRKLAERSFLHRVVGRLKQLVA